MIASGWLIGMGGLAMGASAYDLSLESQRKLAQTTAHARNTRTVSRPGSVSLGASLDPGDLLAGTSSKSDGNAIMNVVSWLAQMGLTLLLDPDLGPGWRAFDGTMTPNCSDAVLNTCDEIVGGHEFCVSVSSSVCGGDGNAKTDHTDTKENQRNLFKTVGSLGIPIST